MHPVVQQHARGARFPGQERRNRFVRVAHVRQRDSLVFTRFLLNRGSRAIRSLCDGAKSARNARRLRGWQVFSDSDERVRLQQDDALTATAEDAAFLPGTHEPTDGIQRRPGHLGDVLTGNGKIDFYTRSQPASCISNESQQGTGDAPFDTLRHQLTVAALQVVQAVRDETDRVDRDRGVRFQ